LNGRGDVDFKHVMEVGFVYDKVPAASAMLRLEIKGMFYICNILTPEMPTSVTVKLPF
jgi:hypothetical protein